MIKIEIDHELKETCPTLVLGCIKAKVKVTSFNQSLWNEIEEKCQQCQQRLALAEVLTLPHIKVARESYKALGKDPSRYKLSSESLLRRIIKGNRLYQVNNVVDINNLLSIVSQHSIGTYDLDQIGEKIYFAIGQDETRYEGIGRGSINLHNIPVFFDEQGPFGSTTSDSTRAMITENTERILMNIISFSGVDGMREYMDYATELLMDYAQGEQIEQWIIE